MGDESPSNLLCEYEMPRGCPRRPPAIKFGGGGPPIENLIPSPDIVTPTTAKAVPRSSAGDDHQYTPLSTVGGELTHAPRCLKAVCRLRDGRYSVARNITMIGGCVQTRAWLQAVSERFIQDINI